MHTFSGTNSSHEQATLYYKYSHDVHSNYYSGNQTGQHLGTEKRLTLSVYIYSKTQYNLLDIRNTPV